MMSEHSTRPCRGRFASGGGSRLRRSQSHTGSGLLQPQSQAERGSLQCQSHEDSGLEQSRPQAGTGLLQSRSKAESGLLQSRPQAESGSLQSQSRAARGLRRSRPRAGRGLLRYALAVVLAAATILGIGAGMAHAEGNAMQVVQGADIHTFAQEAPVSTIYIDQSIIRNREVAELAILQTAHTRYPGLGYTTGVVGGNAGGRLATADERTGKVVYYDTGAGVKTQAIERGKDNVLAGDLFTFTYRDAATLQDGSKADVVLTYSNWHIAIQDNYEPDTYEGRVYIAKGNKLVTCSDEPSVNNGRVGSKIDVNVKVVNKQGVLVPGTFAVPMVDIDVERTGDFSKLYGASTNNNYSEQVRIVSGVAADSKVYVAGPPDSFKLNWTVDQDGSVLFTPKATDDETYYSGFVTVADNTSTAQGGITFTTWLAGSGSAVVRTFLLEGPTKSTDEMLHKIISSSTVGGEIGTTAHGNLDGTMNDGSIRVGPEPTAPNTRHTAVVPDGKTVVYTMTRHPGYQVSFITVDGTTFDQSQLRGLTPGGSAVELTISDGRPGKLRLTDEGTYTFEFPNNNADHEIHVAWEPYRATVKVEKSWNDYNNLFGTRKPAVFHVDAYTKINPNGGTDANNLSPVTSLGTDGKDVLPAQAFAADEWTTPIVWGSQDEYVAANGTVVSATENFLPKYVPGTETEIVYLVREDGVSGYTSMLSVGTKTEDPSNDSIAYAYTASNTLKEQTFEYYLRLTKTIDGQALSEGHRGEFVFTLSGEVGVPMPEVVTRRNGDALVRDSGSGTDSYVDPGVVEFGPISFSYASLANASSKTFTYTVTEQAPSDPRYEPGAKTQLINVTLTANPDATSDAGRVVIAQTPSASTATMDNRYNTASVAVTKTWPGGDPSGISSIPVRLSQLVGTTTVYDYRSAELTGTSWSTQWDSLPLHVGGAPALYSVVEPRVDGYNSSFDTTSTTSTTSYTLTTDDTDPAWTALGSDRQPIQVQLYRNGVAYGPAVTLDQANSWSHVWADLPTLSDDGIVYFYEYDVVAPQDPSTNYQKTLAAWKRSVSYDPTVQVGLTNTAQTITVHGQKHWVDGNTGSDTTGRADYTLSLMNRQGIGNPTAVAGKAETVTNLAQDLTTTWLELPVVDQAGSYYNYSVAETGVPTGYQLQSTTYQGQSITLTVDTDSTVKARWSGYPQADRPYFTLNLLRNGTVVDTAAMQYVSGNSSANWKAEWQGLPTMDATTGEIYVYDWEVANLAYRPADWEYAASGFDAQYDVSKQDTGGYYRTTVTNTQLIEVTITKVWGDNKDPLAPVTVNLIRTTKDNPSNPEDSMDDWEVVATRTFEMDEFTAENNQTVAESYGNLPAFDAEGKQYTYRAYETTKGGSAFRTDLTNNNLTVTNTNQIGDGSAEIVVTKVLEGRSWNSGESYSFILEGQGNAPMPQQGSAPYRVTVSSGGSSGNALVALFEPIQYTNNDANHTYTYTIREEVPTDAVAVGADGQAITFAPGGESRAVSYGDVVSTDEATRTAAASALNGSTYTWQRDGVSYATEPQTVTVRIEQTTVGTGESTTKVVPHVSYANDERSAVFTNSYDADAQVTIPVAKRIPGYQGVDGENQTFTFTLDPFINAPRPQEGSITLGYPGSTAVDDLKDLPQPYTVADTGFSLSYSLRQLLSRTSTAGELSYEDGSPVPADTAYRRFVYVLQESVVGASPRYAYDTSPIYVRVTVIDKRDGTMDHKLDYFSNPLCRDVDRIDTTTPTFTNVQLFDLPVKKAWKGLVRANATIELQQLMGSTWQTIDSYEYRRDAAYVQETESDVRSYTYTFAGLPAYDASGAAIQYRVRETDPAGSAYTTSYQRGNETATQGEASASTTLADGVSYTVTNEYEPPAAEAQVAVVKELLNRTWLEQDVDSYSFKLTPYQNGSSIAPADVAQIPMPGTENGAGQHASDYAPGYATTGEAGGHDAQQIYAGTKVSKYDEYVALFGTIKIGIGDLTQDPVTGAMSGDFFYRLEEIVPTEAVSDKTTTRSTADDDVRRGVAYPKNATHYVHIHAEDDARGTITARIYYDEATPGNPLTAVFFAPVVSNEYDSIGTGTAHVTKYLMGRDWAADDSFTYTLTSVGNAPLRDGSGRSLDALSITVGKSSEESGPESNSWRRAESAPIQFRLSDLTKTVPANNASAHTVVLSDGSPAKPGLKYDRFTYAIEEERSTRIDGLLYDEDTEYVIFTVVDTGEGTLDVKASYANDRNGRHPRVFDVGHPEGAPFTNIEIKDISVTKVWDGVPSGSVTVRLLKAELDTTGLPYPVGTTDPNTDVTLIHTDDPATSADAYKASPLTPTTAVAPGEGNKLIAFDGKTFEVSEESTVIKVPAQGDKGTTGAYSYFAVSGGDTVAWLAGDFYRIPSGFYPARFNESTYLVPVNRFGPIDTTEWASVSGTSVSFAPSDFGTSNEQTREFTGLPMMVQRTDSAGVISERYVAYLVLEDEQASYGTTYAVSGQVAGEGDEAGDMHRYFTVSNRSTYEASVGAHVGVAKELVGRDWRADDSSTAGKNEEDRFAFELLPLGKGTYDADGSPQTTTTQVDGHDVTLPVYERTSGNDVNRDIPMPNHDAEGESQRKTYGENSYMPAEGTIAESSQRIADSQREDVFDDITFTQDDLVYAGGIYQADFYYEMREKMGDDFIALAKAGTGDTAQDYLLIRGEKYRRVTDASDFLTYAEWKAGSSTTAYDYWLNPANGISYTSETHTVHVHVENSTNGLVYTVAYDDGEMGGSVPAFTNYYDALGTDHAVIIKHIAGRDWKEFPSGGDTFSGSGDNLALNGDAFRFYYMQVGGATMAPTAGEAPEHDFSILTGGNSAAEIFGGVLVDPDTWITPAITTASTALGGKNGRTDHAIRSGEGMYHLSDLAYNSATGQYEGSFVHVVTEVESFTEQGVTKWPSIADLSYDSNVIYMQTLVRDDGEGRIHTWHRYYTDASCRNEITGHEVWVDEQGFVVSESLAREAEDHKVSHTAYFGAKDEDHAITYYSYTPSGADAPTYYRVNAAYFSNSAITDVPVRKLWDGVPVEDVTLRIQRALVSADTTAASIDDAMVYGVEGDDNQNGFLEATDAGAASQVMGVWRNIGRVYTIQRGAFLKQDGTPDYETGTTLVSKTYGGSEPGAEPAVEGFNKSLPMFVEEQGTLYRAVYRVVEDNTSSVYEASYGSVGGTKQGSDAPKTTLNYYVDPDNSSTLVVTNETTATNTANLSAVKQLVGREWLDTVGGKKLDRYSFTLTPVGRGTYDPTTGELKVEDGEPVYATLANGAVDTQIPMPTARVSSELGAGATNKALAAKTTLFADGRPSVEEVVGVGERLARFGAISFSVADLEKNEKTGSMRGDFFYRLSEDIPADAVAADGSGITYGNATAVQKARLVWVHEGIRYDGTVRTVHIHVTDNRTNTLTVQVAYDEQTVGDVGTGSQFTPMFTNYYDAQADWALTIEKRLMGRGWKLGDSFDFTMNPLGGAPFEDTNPATATEPSVDFPAGDEDEGTQAHMEAAFAEGKAAHTAEGAHIKRMTVAQGDLSKSEIPLTLPSIHFVLASLNQTTNGTTAGLTYADGTEVPGGLKYGQFVYAVEEVATNASDLQVDPNAEYARITVIDRGDGTLDRQVRFFEDRFATIPRKDPDNPNVDASEMVFVNQLKRDLMVTKTWVGPVVSDVSVKLQWAVEDPNQASSWHDAEGTPWLAGITPTHTFETTEGTHPSYTFAGLPAYAETGTGSAILDLDDRWVYYRVVETTTESTFSPRYGDFVEGRIDKSQYDAVPHHTEAEKSGNAYVNPRTTSLGIINFTSGVDGSAVVSAVKQFIGRPWKATDSFQFSIEPLGKASYRVEEGTLVVDEIQQTDAAVQEAAKAITTGGSTMSISTDSAAGNYAVSENEYSNSFKPLQFTGVTIADLTRDPASGSYVADYYYTIREVIANTAVGLDELSAAEQLEANHVATEHRVFNGKVYEVIEDAAYATHRDDTEPDGQDGTRPRFTQWLDRSNGIAYTSETHTVRVHVVDNGNGTLSTQVSYDGREPGGFVPVFTNHYDASGKVAINVRKHVGGGNAEGAFNGAYRFELVPMPGAAWGTGTDALYTTIILDPTNLNDVQTDFGKHGDFEADGWYYLSDLNGLNEGDFVYAIHEVDPRDPSSYLPTDSDDDGTPDALEYRYREGDVVKTGVVTHVAGDGLIYDGDTVYAKLHIQDAGAGHLEQTVTYHRTPDCGPESLITKADTGEATTQGEDPATTPTTFAPFENDPTREVTVTKVWDGPAVQDSTFKLQSRVGTGAWSDVAGVDPITITLDDFHYDRSIETPDDDAYFYAGGQKVRYETATDRMKANMAWTRPSVSRSFTLLPAYEDDQQVDYRVVETSIPISNPVSAYMVRYEILDAQGAPVAGSDADYQVSNQISVPDVAVPTAGSVRISNRYLPQGTASINAVKQLPDRLWQSSDRYDFEIVAIDKRIPLGSVGAYISVTDESIDDASVLMPVPSTNDYPHLQKNSPIGAAVKTGSETTASGSSAVDVNQASASWVAGNERLASFKDIIYTIGDLAYNEQTRRFESEFVYTLREAIPADATATINGTPYTYADAVAAQSVSAAQIKAATWRTANGVTYTTDEHTVVVRVYDSVDGTLHVERAYDPDQGGVGRGFTPVFINRYGATGHVRIPVAKHIAGSSWQTNDAFGFEIEALPGTVAPLDATTVVGYDTTGSSATTHKVSESDPDSTADRWAFFPEITLPGEGSYGYRISETSMEGGRVDLAQGTDAVYVKVDVAEEPSTGVLKATLSYYGGYDFAQRSFSDPLLTAAQLRTVTDGATNLQVPVFNNLTTKDLYVRKTWLGRAQAQVTVTVQQSTNATTGEDGDWTTVKVGGSDAKRVFATNEFTFASGATSASADWHVGRVPTATDDGTPIQYRVIESTGTNFELVEAQSKRATVGDSGTTATGTSADPLLLVNRSTVATTVMGVKRWIDPKTTDPTAAWERPASSLLKLTLHRRAGSAASMERTPFFDANGPIGSADIDGNAVTLRWDEDAYYFQNLPTYAASGATYSYWVTEEQVAGYEAPSYTSIFGLADSNGAPNMGYIVNTAAQEYAPISVTKLWDDENNRDGVRPASITLHLYRDGSELVTSEELQTDSGNEQPVIFTRGNGDGVAAGYEKYAPDGHVYAYEVREEASLRTRYHQTYLDAQDEDLDSAATGAPDGGKIKNSYEPEQISVSGTKAWEHADNPDAVPESATVYLQRREVRDDWTSTDEGWEYVKDDKTGTSDQSAAWKATLSGSDWSYEFPDLPLFKEKTSTSENGVELEYRVVEDPVPTHYVVSGGDALHSYDLTNSYQPTPVTLDQFHYINVNKVIDGPSLSTVSDADWATKQYAFAFQLSAAEGTPMPESNGTYGTHTAEIGSGRWATQVVVTPTSTTNVYANPDEATASDAVSVAHAASFGPITYTVPGTYEYDLREIMPDEVWQQTPNYAMVKHFPGMTYNTGEFFTVQVKVEAIQGNSELRISQVLLHHRGDEQHTIQDLTARVHNSYDPNSVTYQMEAEKSYRDYADATAQLGVGQFSFKMWPVGDNAATAPMPQTAFDPTTGVGLQGVGANRVYIARNVDEVVFFEGAHDGLTFTGGSIPTGEESATYTYRIAEIIPDGATYLSDGYWYDASSGVFYDGAVHARSIKVSKVNEVLTIEHGEETGIDDYFLDPLPGTAYRDVSSQTPTVTSGERLGAFASRHTGVGDLPLFLNHRETLTDVSVTKLWDDDGDRDGLRPWSVTLQLQRRIGDETPVVVTQDALGVDIEPRVIRGDATGGDLVASWQNLPTHDINHHEYHYQVVEVGYRTSESAALSTDFSAIGYEVSYRTATGTTVAGHAHAGAPQGGVVVNSHMPATGALRVSKVWNDHDNQDGLRADVTLHLYRQLRNADGVLRFRDGEPMLVQVDGVEPRTIAGDATAVAAHTLWEGLPIHEGGRPIRYWVREAAIGGYTASYAYPAVGGTGADAAATDQGVELSESVTKEVTITNTRTPEQVSEISVRKVWVDDNDADGLRRDVVVRLLANGEPVKVENNQGEPVDRTITLSASGGWAGSFTNLAKNASGTPIAYTVEEVVPEGYGTPVITGCVGQGFTITNTHERQTTSLRVEKTWDDANDKDGARPEYVEFQILKRLGGTGTWQDAGSFVASAADASADNASKWVATVEGLPVRELENGESKGVAYRVVEHSTETLSRAGYNLTGADGAYVSPTVEPAEGALAVAGGTISFAVTNTRSYDTTDVTLTKRWEDEGNRDGLRPVAEEFAAMLTLEADGADVTATYAGRLSVTDNGDDSYTATWSGLPRFAERQVDGSRRAIAYLPGENAAAEGLADVYTAGELAGTQAEGFTLTNAHVGAKTSVTITKVWDDDENQDGLRPSSVTLQLMKHRSDQAASQAEAVGVATLTAADASQQGSDEWTHTWSDLPATEDGHALVYFVTEPSVPHGYAVEYRDGEDHGVAATSGGAPAGGRVVNTRDASTTSVSAIKVWANDEGSSHPEITLSLTATAGGQDVTEWALTQARSERDRVIPADATGSTLAVSWQGLPTHKEGSWISYTVDEVTVPEGYTKSVSGNADIGFTITNTRIDTVPEIEIVAYKRWEGAEAPEGEAANVRLTLLAHTTDDPQVWLWLGTKDTELTQVGNAQLPMAKWTHVYTHYHERELAFEVIEEDVPTGYAMTPGTVDNGYVVTNTPAGPASEVTATKTWADANDQDGKRRSVTLRLQQSTDGGATWSDDVRLADGSTPTMEVRSGDGAWQQVTYGTTWQVGRSNDDANQVRWTGLPTVLKGDGSFAIMSVEEARAEAEAAAKDEADEGDKDEADKDDAAENAETEADGTADGAAGDRRAAGTNALPTGAGDGADGQDGTAAGGSSESQDTPRAASDGTGTDEGDLAGDVDDPVVTPAPEADDEPAPLGRTGDEPLDASNDASGTDTLPGGDAVTPAGEDQISVSSADAYEPTDGDMQPAEESTDFPGASMAASHVVAQRVPNRIVRLLALVEGLHVEATAEPKAVYYRVVEEAVPDGYECVSFETAPGVFELINIHTPETRDFQVRKLWDDNDDAYGARPATITLRLLADGVPLPGSEAEVGATDDWTQLWSDLPRYAAGTEIAYSAEEVDVPSSYTASVVSDGPGSCVITNIYNGDLSITVQKLWQRAEGSDIKPGDGTETPRVSMQLFRGDVPVGDPRVIPSAAHATDEQMTATWDDLPSFDENERISYAVVETIEPGEGLDGWQVGVADTIVENGRVVFTNRLLPKQEEKPDPTPGPTPTPTPDTTKLIKVTYVDHLLGEDGRGGELKNESEIVLAFKARPADIDATKLAQVGETITAQAVDSPEGEALLAQALSGTEAGDELTAQFDEEGASDSERGHGLAAQFDEEGSPDDAERGDEAEGAESEGSDRPAADEASLRAQAETFEAKVPGDPGSDSHEGYAFSGWTINRDAFGDYTMVAHHTHESELRTIWVDGQNGSVSDSQPEANPRSDGLVFDGWEKVTDSAGNTVWVARWKPAPVTAPSGTANPTASGIPVAQAAQPIATASTAKAATLPQTSDPNAPEQIFALMGLGTSLSLSGIGIRLHTWRRRTQNRRDGDQAA